MNNPESSELGKKTIYPRTYDKKLLFPIPRSENRHNIGIGESLPFKGFDLWTAWEVSFLNHKGKPLACIADIVIPCESKYIVESKSLKLYFNSLNDHKFDSIKQAQNAMASDLSEYIQAEAQVSLKSLDDYTHKIHRPEGVCLDEIDISWQPQPYAPETLKVEGHEQAKETLYSNLLKSNCPVTNQPDWATIFISYEGQKLDHESVLKYILSFRNHNEFHEQCVERIFQDISKCALPKSLTVSARYTRRGGIDINPVRSSLTNLSYDNLRLVRQ